MIEIPLVSITPITMMSALRTYSPVIHMAPQSSFKQRFRLMDELLIKPWLACSMVYLHIAQQDANPSRVKEVLQFRQIVT